MPGIYDTVTPWATGPDLYPATGGTQGAPVERIQTGWNWSGIGQGIVYFDLSQLNAPNPYYQPLVRYDESISLAATWPISDPSMDTLNGY